MPILSTSHRRTKTRKMALNRMLFWEVKIKSLQ